MIDLCLGERLHDWMPPLAIGSTYPCHATHYAAVTVTLDADVRPTMLILALVLALLVVGAALLACCCVCFVRPPRCAGVPGRDLESACPLTTATRTVMRRARWRRGGGALAATVRAGGGGGEVRQEPLWGPRWGHTTLGPGR